jgi:anion-transporting  ArsA/GET3 family ATPase
MWEKILKNQENDEERFKRLINEARTMMTLAGSTTADEFDEKMRELKKLADKYDMDWQRIKDYVHSGHPSYGKREVVDV